MFLCRRELARHPEDIDENLICMFCMDVCCEPIECMGPCKTKCCRRCASQWCHNGQRIVSCPKKCSTPWKFRLLSAQPTPMTCPYSPDCKINFVEELAPHMMNCEFQPTEMLMRKQLRKNFQCMKGHLLKFFVGSFDELTKSICQQCGEKGSCRSKCLKCKVMYCVKCREPPCSQECCPNDHKYTFVKPSTSSTVCDICSMCPYLVGLGVHTDKFCNFDICEKCFEHLPKTKSQTVIKSHKQDDTLCEKQHPLKKIRQPVMKICKSCEMQRPCWKICENCQDFYCINCKEPNINELNECDEGHRFKASEDERMCMSCDAGPSRCAIDPDCGLCLCAKCYKRYVNIDAEKRRLIKTFLCPHGHPLRYYVTLQKSKCAECNQQRIFQLYCGECIPNKVYCLRCKKIDVRERCYYGDPLKKCDKVPKICLFCQQEKNDVWECKRCKLVVCETCKQSSADK